MCGNLVVKLYNLYRSTTCIHVDLSFAKLAFYIDMFSMLFLRELKIDAPYVLEKYCYFKTCSSLANGKLVVWVGGLDSRDPVMKGIVTVLP